MDTGDKDFTVVFDAGGTRGMVPVTGAYGGPTPDGVSVVAHLYVEHVTVPSLTAHAIGKTGEVDLQGGQHIRRADLTREVQATLVMSPEHAQVVGKWLQEKGKQAMKNRETKGGKGKSKNE